MSTGIFPTRAFSKRANTLSTFVLKKSKEDPTGPFRSKNTTTTVNYYAYCFFTTPPYLLRREPSFERQHVCKTKENGVRTRRTAIANHSAIVVPQTSFEAKKWLEVNFPSRGKFKIFPQAVKVPFPQTLHFLGKQCIPRERESYFHALSQTTAPAS